MKKYEILADIQTLKFAVEQRQELLAQILERLDANEDSFPEDWWNEDAPFDPKTGTARTLGKLLAAQDQRT